MILPLISSMEGSTKDITLHYNLEYIHNHSAHF